MRRGVQTAEESLELFKRIEAEPVAFKRLLFMRFAAECSAGHSPSQKDPKGQSDAYAVLARAECPEHSQSEFSWCFQSAFWCN